MSLSSLSSPSTGRLDSLGALLSAQLAAHPGQSGARLLSDGIEAFAARAASARAATRSIDLQYYIWRNDVTGRLLAHEVLQAADRGVRVRLLLDDMDARSHDELLVAFDRHPAIEVRVFNPFRTRRGLLRTARELLVHGSRLNHRMHNKAWIVDGRLAIVGGRNIGDEYFAASDGVNFIDTDVIIAGRAVDDALAIFDEYWNSTVVRHIRRFTRTRRAQLTLDALRARLVAPQAAAQAEAYERRVRESMDPQKLLGGVGGFSWSEVRVVADDPRKALRGRPHGPGVLEDLIEAVAQTRRELLLISPYFVPGPGGTAALREVSRRGARVAVLTNSLAATDVAAVHSGYSRYRRALLEGGVELHELKSAVGSDEARRLRIGSSRASLHTKAAIVDGVRLFVGSFNIDPRSAQLNCEMGVWMEAEALAQRLRAAFESAISPERSYRLSLDAVGRKCWSETRDGEPAHYTREPHASRARRLLTWTLSRLPIESQL